MMSIGFHKCNRVDCHFLVEEGIQCNSCKKWYHKMCTGLRPAAYKRCCTVASHWMCTTCCSPKMTLIREAYELLSMAMELPDDSVVYKGDTDCLSGSEAESVIIKVIPPVVTTPATPDIGTVRRSKRLSKRKNVNKTKAADSISLSENAVDAVCPEGGVNVDPDCTIKDCNSTEKQLQLDSGWINKTSNWKKVTR